MEIKLDALYIRNFKGIKEFALKPGGHNISVYGDNAVGKTTVFDAFLWLLLGKDSQGRADFEIKPLDASGNELHGVDIEVEAVLDVDGEKRKLKKVQRENWVKQKGRAEAVFSGNETSCEIDDVPKKIGEYQKFCASLADADVFKLVTSTTAFNSMNTQDKRAALLKICKADSGVPCDGRFAKIPVLLGHATPQEAKKRLKSQRDALNREIAQIPARIDENSAQIVTVTPTERQDAAFNIKDIRGDMAEIDRQIAQLQASDPVLGIDRQCKQIESELELERRKRHMDRGARLSTFEREIADGERSAQHYEFELRLANSEMERLKKSEESYKADIAALREKWRAIHSETFNVDSVSEICPTCGQRIPEDQREKALEHAMSEFLASRKAREDAVNVQGKEISIKIETTRKQLAEATSKADALSMQLEASRADVQKRQLLLEEAKSLPETVSEREKELTEQLDGLSKAVVSGSNADRIAGLNGRKSELAARLDKHLRNQYAWERSDKAEQRVEELTLRQKELGEQIAQADLDIMLIDDYVTESCKRLEEGVNKLFKTVRWKLFDQCDNGSYKDVCVCTVGGVPYGSLNNAARINAGLEIINVLSDFYDIRMPIFIDNAESINQLVQTESQQIRLVVSHDKELTIQEDEREWKIA